MDTRATRAEISTSALNHNISLLKQRIGTAKLCLILKANAYGHGLAPFARLTQENAHCFAVATVNEAIKIREVGVKKPILILSPHLKEEIPALIDYQLTPLISHSEYLSAYSDIALKRGIRIPVHLKIDTGMSRCGVFPDEALNLAKHIMGSEGLELSGLCTHYANADETWGKESVFEQFSLFEKVRCSLEDEGIKPSTIHTANTGASILYPETHKDMVRIGLGIYGYFDACDIGLKPILSLKSKIMLAKTIKAGVKVSYGHTWTASKDTQIGIVPAGYADGYTRHLSNKGKVLIDGNFYPIIGRVCMDQMVVDISGLANPLEKDVLLYGDHPLLNASKLAGQANTCSYEVLTTLAERVPRIYV
ncbi:MAG: alanine racemase [Brevinema sp.]